MTRNRTLTTVHTVVCLVASAFLLTSSGEARTPAASTAGNGLGFVYDAAREITFVGTVQGFISQSVLHSPAGVHLLISNGEEICDIDLGPYVSSENQQSLPTGQLVQVTGVSESVHGKSVLLARQLIYQGRLVIVRNERGLLVHNIAALPKNRGRKSVMNGGTQ